MKTKKLWITRDTVESGGSDLGYFWVEEPIFNKEYAFYPKEGNRVDCFCMEDYDRFRRMIGISLRPGQKKQIEIREIKKWEPK